MARKAGRPTSLTPERLQLLVEALETGCPRKQAAILAGVTDTTFYSWMKWGEQGKQPYADCLAKVREAEARGMARNLALIQDAAPRDWKAAAWILERRHPADFARHDHHEVTGGGGGPIKVSFQWTEEADD